MKKQVLFVKSFSANKIVIINNCVEDNNTGV